MTAIRINTLRERRDDFPTPDEIGLFRDAGYETDEHGRPLHPWIGTELENPEWVDGKGERLYQWGPNYAVDPVVITTEARPRILIIHRGGPDGPPALPGGFLDAEETDPESAARRELKEETGIMLGQQGHPFYYGVVADKRATKNAWVESFGYVYTVPEPFPIEQFEEEDEKAGAHNPEWRYLDEIEEELYGSHATLIRQALEYHAPHRTIQEIIAIPENERETIVIDAGHMAYDHSFTRHGSDHLFVKAHDPSRFTDPKREAHSREYLEKEFAFFTYLPSQHYERLPARVDLIEDRILAMDALHRDGGWWWRAPRGEHFHQYVENTLTSFDELQAVTPPENPPYHETIEDTYTTLWKEGWDDIDDEKLEAIVAKIRSFSETWDDAQRSASEELIRLLPTLRDAATSLTREPELFLAHNDARQSNIAWHPEHGTKLIDWSWGDVAPKDADATMFLIDLAKADHDVSNYLSRFNNDHAVVLIGFWLAHSLWQTRDGSTTVREHQVASAVAAARLLGTNN